jgi:DNA-binding NarL/FixJ family response regulator
MNPPSPSAPALRILLADDHEMIRRGTRLLLESQPGWQVCAEAATGPQAVAAAVECRPDVAIIDVVMPGLDGLEVVRQIRKAAPQIELVTFTAQTSEVLVQNLFAAGVRSCILKSEDGEHLLAAVRAAAGHKPYFTAHASEILFSRYLQGKAEGSSAQPGSPLSPREHEVLRLVALGQANKEISELLGLSIRTVETHRAALLHKLGLKSVADLVRYAIRNGLIEA